MVVSTANQLSSTYTLWQRFTFPSEHGPRDAVAVPNSVAEQLNSAYTLIIDMALVQFFTILFGISLYFYLRKYNAVDRMKNISPLAPTIWNKRADLVDLIVETGTSKDNWHKPNVILLLFAFLILWVGVKATGVLVPPLLTLGTAAPVNPAAIYVPDRTNDNNAETAALFPLEVPRFIRALGSTVNEEIRSKVNVSDAKPIGQTSNGERILQIDYSYNATGADFGLQKYPELTLNVVGSCTTEYGWLNVTAPFIYNNDVYVIDWYNLFGNTSMNRDVSLFDGREPVGSFFIGDPVPGILPDSNATWAALVSSVNRTSFSPGTDPWYLTGPGISNSGAGYAVLAARPALSCWEDNIWSYKGHNSTIGALTSTALPGFEISDSLQDIFAAVLGTPMIQSVGQHLQSSALLSTSTASNQIFDASSSSVHDDLERLVQAAYVATVNILTDLTLYPVGASRDVRNVARGDSGQTRDGISDFVVWSPEIKTLSTLVVIVIPSVFVGLWLIAIILMYYTPVGIVTTLDSSDLQGLLARGGSDERAMVLVNPPKTPENQSVTNSNQGVTGNETTGTTANVTTSYNVSPITESGLGAEKKD
ncbi:uncharacterized protein GGS22DRAFT_154308 [Annulohypoxylon maeteangense]|uniref:uncharacterized protein n=1 Tax=Annulohypoxylon maeteangense TaxID=1927788 RepID=UPI002007F9B1|nr:uncharacterized protein GGS22DRAFT_154308 [Annulohypoxylon maeteangense]KAI0887797.1 hypothetical protein GGS22DRAFT_154308 [Annulohypoxylon maeteangense]